MPLIVNPFTFPRIAIVPDWDEDQPLEENLPYFPGAQIQVTIPERIAR